MTVSFCPGIMRHTPTGENRYSLPAFGDDLGNGAPQLVGSMGLRQRRHIDVDKERHDWNLALLDNVFKGHNESMTHESFVAEGDVELTLEATVKARASQRLMHRRTVLLATE